MSTKEIQSSLFATAHAYQCAALVEYLSARNPRATGFHALAARRMADRAWLGFQSLATDDTLDYQQVFDTLDGVADCAESAGRILTAYVTQSNE